ncbi:MoaD/ThiS family protein [Phycicoccus sp. BSK3Z-2]|uniref:MoaD/ThiS family protein n=1 Tax=Phycicoccus avicenniae TaxID=2828860 RepID=A0A941D4E3_9MICO|nr:MoaD/ThiS family protein [Phycicoccus avicenniae]MBR7741899.1 MoaD/ThiS family protein [Phycicoccus avicenniae]
MQDHSATTGDSGTTSGTAAPTGGPTGAATGEPAGGAAASGEVTVRYWAGARAAAGVESETVPGLATVGDLAAALGAARPALGPVLEVATLLLDGRAATPEQDLPAGSVVEVLPPFAGG